MGKETLSRTSYNSAVNKHVPTLGPATRRGTEEVRKTGKLNPLVDPAEFGVIRRSLPRFEPFSVKKSEMQNLLHKITSGELPTTEVPSKYLDDVIHYLRLTVGTPMPVRSRLDTTGSMGNNVEIALRVLPDTFGLCSEMLPGYDLQMAIDIFGDCEDNFVLCRPQYEMTAEKLVEQLTLMVPEGLGGGNGGEDPQYGLFGAAYLTSAYINRVGLKGYDFTISDEPARDMLSERQLIRIFGNEVFNKTAENGFTIDKFDIPTTKTIVSDLLNLSHAFFLEVERNDHRTHKFWTNVFGPERVIVLPEMRLLPYIQAVIIGLTEGVIGLSEVADFLKHNNVNLMDSRGIARSVSNIPIGAQATLREKLGRPLPRKGDFFKAKTDLWPVDSYEAIINAIEPKPENNEGPNWL